MNPLPPKDAEAILKAKTRKYKQLYVQYKRLEREGCTCDYGSQHSCPYCAGTYRLDKQMKELLGIKT